MIVRGDSYYGRPEAMACPDVSTSATSSGQPATRCALRRVGPLAGDATLGRLTCEGEKVRRRRDSR